VKNSSEPEAKAIQKEIDDYIFVKTDGKIISKSLCKDICYIEGLKNYVAIHLNDKQILPIIL
jgi:hypothetical protein